MLNVSPKSMSNLMKTHFCLIRKRKCSQLKIVIMTRMKLKRLLKSRRFKGERLRVSYANLKILHFIKRIILTTKYLTHSQSMWLQAWMKSLILSLNGLLKTKEITSRENSMHRQWSYRTTTNMNISADIMQKWKFCKTISLARLKLSQLTNEKITTKSCIKMAHQLLKLGLQVQLVLSKIKLIISLNSL